MSHSFYYNLKYIPSVLISDPSTLERMIVSKDSFGSVVHVKLRVWRRLKQVWN